MLVDAEDDMDADIAAAIASVAADAPPEPPQPPAAEPPEPLKDASEQTDGRARDEAGKFVAKAPEPAQNPQASPDAPAAPPEETSRPPHTLKATLKAKWATLDPEVRQEFERVEGEVQTAKSEWASKGERLNKFDALLAPYKDKFALSGTDEFAAVQSLLAAQRFLEEKPNEAIAYLARQYGAQPQAFQGQTQNLGQEQPPGFAELQREIAELKAERQREVQEREQTAKSEAVAEWSKFREDPAYPYAVNVQEHMHALLSTGRATNLKDAYDQAVWANPETRALLQKQVAAPAPVKDAKPAGLGVIGGPGTVRRPVGDVNPETSLEEDIRAAYASLSGR